MKPKYSVIIPVYNAEKTLNRCIDSLLEENYMDAEIILVNDGSRDRSGDICQSYAAGEHNIRYVDKENGGVSTARNAGLDIAAGEYILFVDSDDYVAPGYFSTIESLCNKTHGDLIQFSVQFDNGKQKKKRLYTAVSTYTRKALAPRIMEAIHKKTINAPWAKLFKRKIIEDYHIRFPVGVSVGEDYVFNLVYSFFIQSYTVTDKVVYVVNTENEHSLTRGRQEGFLQQCEIAEEFFYRMLDTAPLSAKERDNYCRAYNFGKCRGTYHKAKLMHKEKLGWFARQKRLMQICDRINGQHMKFPNTGYCKLIAIPVQLKLTVVIDIIAWKLTH